MLEYAPSLEHAISDRYGGRATKILATELEEAGLITNDQIRSFLFHDDAKATAAVLLGMVTIKVYSNSENFTTFLDVLKKDKETYGHILAKMEEKGIYVCDNSVHSYGAYFVSKIRIFDLECEI